MIESFIWTLVGAAIGIVGTVIVQKQSDKKHEEAERGKVAQAASEERAKQLRYWDNLNCDSDREPMDPTTVSLFYDVRTCARSNQIAVSQGSKIPVPGVNLPLGMIYQRIAPGMLPQEVEQLANAVTGLAEEVESNVANDPTDKHLEFEFGFLGDLAQKLVKTRIALASPEA